MSDVLVTGAAGFIGAAVARQMIERGHSVVTIDDLSTGYSAWIPPQCRSIIGDLAEPAVVAELYDREFDTIFHLAGQSGGIPSFQDPVRDLKSNVVSTLMLLDLAHRTGCSSFVYASSMAIYGDPSGIPVSEDAPLAPKSFYAVGKLASEQYMRLYADRGVACTSLRINNTYGPGQDLSNLQQGMVSIFLGQAIAERRVLVKGDRRRFRDFVYVDDVVDSFVRAGQFPPKSGFAAYNVATAQATTVEQLISLIRTHLPFEISVQYAGSTPGDQFGITCAYDRIAQDLGWKPATGIEDGIARTVRWALGTCSDSLPDPAPYSPLWSD